MPHSRPTTPSSSRQWVLFLPKARLTASLRLFLSLTPWPRYTYTMSPHTAALNHGCHHSTASPITQTCTRLKFNLPLAHVYNLHYISSRPTSSLTRQCHGCHGHYPFFSSITHSHTYIYTPTHRDPTTSVIKGAGAPKAQKVPRA